MARDRKRAKQRQRRRAQHQPRPESTDGKARERADEAPDDVDEVVEDEIVHEDHEEDPTAAPDPLAHASADADIARIAETSAPDPGADDAPLEADEYPQPDETEPEGADAFGRTPEERRAPARAGAELPREGNRFANFLRACVAELRRVQWPDRETLIQATAITVIFIAVMAAYLGVLDTVFNFIVQRVL